jgi:adhesin HecA-like repeat protein
VCSSDLTFEIHAAVDNRAGQLRAGMTGELPLQTFAEK